MANSKNISNMWNSVILVDEKDTPIGTEEKLAAHENGQLHRAFSIFLFNKKGELLLQRRAAHKYHSPGLWTNTCCSHPQPGRDLAGDAHARLMIEMGIDCPIHKAFDFIYRAAFENGLTEYEFDHVFFGDFDGDPVPNPEEVDGWRWVSLQEIDRDIQENPEAYTAWFRECFPRIMQERIGKA